MFFSPSAELTVTATRKETADPQVTQLDLVAVCAGEKVLAQARALVRTDALAG